MTNRTKIIVLAGGSGSRVRDFVRYIMGEEWPKQFIKICNGLSTFQATILRALSLVNKDDDICVVTTASLSALAKMQLQEIDVSPTFLVEEHSNNTLAAMQLALDIDSMRSATICVMSSDNIVIDNEKSFESLIKCALDNVKKDNVTLFGIKATQINCGFGHIVAERSTSRNPAYGVRRFVEKPEPALATELMLHNDCWWNSGMSVFDGDSMFRKIASKNKRCLSGKSIDETILNDGENLFFIPMTGVYWADIGSKESLSKILANT